ncbi:MAG TPA: NAD(P)/FAD-dependent oxidoreductase [Burkholderiaceae bacterium]|nr:NAD(P)/FAD-dependent oxidoreductase [Burkholderiaceae bacterium]
MDTIDTLVIGAGVVGLACARSLARAGHEVVVLEAENDVGTVTSSRNSEVIHAGLYYPTGSLKARLCVAGKRMLYDYCAQRAIAHRRCGKLIVATHDGQVEALRALQTQAAANGVDDVQWLSAHEAKSLEPQLACVAALLSPSTGIIDSHGLMLALQGEAESHGAMVAFESKVVGARVTPAGIEVDVDVAESRSTVLARNVVNSAGLQAPHLAVRIVGLDPRHVPRGCFSKGSYFSLAGRAPFERLVYPMHEGAWLGVHLTLDLAGQARFGPDAQWLADDTDPDAIDYHVDPRRADVFYEAIRRYWPALPDAALQPAYAGVRPKIHGPGEPAPDFLIQGPDTHGVPGLINLFGIESPGLTASLAIGDHTAALLAGALLNSL